MGTVRHWSRRRRGLVAAAVVALVTLPAVRAATHAIGPTPSPVAGCGDVGVTGGDWPTYGHDLANTRNQSHERAISDQDAATLAPAWTFSSNAAGGSGDFTGTPAVADGCLFAGSNGGWVYAMNADTGKLVWKAAVPRGGLINGSVAVDGGTVYAAVSKTSRSAGCTSNCVGPYVVALDEATGAVKWASDAIDAQPGADVYGSPVVFNGLVFEGVSGGSAELGDQTDRYDFQGSFVLLYALTGALVKKTYTIHSPDTHDGFAGAGIWSTPAVDTDTGYAYVGTANPFQPKQEAPNADSVIKIDLDSSRATFGQIVGHYKGNVDTYVDQSQLPCLFPGQNPGTYPQGLGSCAQQDLDFGASPNIFTDANGRKLVGAGQKSGVYHAFDAATMAPVWQTPVGVPSAFGGIVGSTAIDENGIYGPITTGGYLWSLNYTGGGRWVAPVADGVHWGNPVAVANGITYTVDLKGFLDAYDNRIGTPLLHRPIAAGSGTGNNLVASWGGVTVARNTVYAAVGISGLPDGFIVAFKPGGIGNVPSPPPPPTVPGGPGTPSGANTVVAGPGAVVTTYATPLVSIQHGQSLSFTNLDAPQHDVQGNGFGSPLISTGQSTPVTGVAQLPPGSYPFFCSRHRNMTGTLVVN